LVGRRSATWTTLLAHFALSYFSDRVLPFAWGPLGQHTHNYAQLIG
jgi:hypothetical protein